MGLDWPEQPTRDVTFAATVNVADRDLDSIDLTLAMLDGHPRAETTTMAASGRAVWSQASGWDDVGPAATTGSVAWSTDYTVPWAWPPAPGADVVPTVASAGRSFRLAQLRADVISGSASSPQITTTLTDATPDLSVTTTVPAMASTMPPYSWQSATAAWRLPRRVGLCGTWMTDVLLRAAQRFCTPRAWFTTIFSAPMMGSAWPEVGKCLTASRRGDTGQLPAQVATAYGVALANLAATYAMSASTSAPVITVGITPPIPSTGRSITLVTTVDGVGVLVGQDSDGDRILYGLQRSGSRVWWSIPREGATRAALRVWREGTTIALRLRTSDGREVTASETADVWSGWSASRVEVDAPGAAPFVVVDDNPASPWDTLEAPQNARIRQGQVQWWRLSPALDDVDVGATLKQQVQAECAAMWIDHQDVLQWASRDVLEAQPVTTTFTTDLRLDDLAYTHSLEQSYRRARLDVRVARLQEHTTPRATVWQGAGDELDGGETSEQEIRVPDEEEWIGVDTSLSKLSSSTTDSAFRTGSWFGGWQRQKTDSSSDGQEPGWPISATLGSSFGQERALLLTASVPATLDPAFTMTQRVPEAGTQLQPFWGGYGLPIIRAHIRATWADSYRTQATGWSRGAPLYIHFAGHWVQDDTRRGELLAWLAHTVGLPVPDVTLTVELDPTVRIGDRVRARDLARSGVTLEVVVSRIQIRSSDPATMTISGRITSATVDPTVQQTPTTHWLQRYMADPSIGSPGGAPRPHWLQQRMTDPATPRPPDQDKGS